MLLAWIEQQEGTKALEGSGWTQRWTHEEKGNCTKTSVFWVHLMAFLDTQEIFATSMTH